jgi:DNA repair protein RecN (Recombination protein N)
MLQLLSVRNFAVIDQVDVELYPEMTVLTGETGAGKSILVDALGLALGERADASAVRAGCDRAEITAVFDCEKLPIAQAWLAERGLDDDQECLLRRVITQEGRSRAFINGNPVNLRDMRTLRPLLVDIHGQHAHQSLVGASVQRRIVDFHGGHLALVEAVSAAFEGWRDIQAQLDRFSDGQAEVTAQLDLCRFQLEELEQLSLVEGEVAELSGERDRLANVNALTEQVGQSLLLLDESERAPALELTGQAQRLVEDMSALDTNLEPAAIALTEAEIQLREAVSVLRQYRDGLELDPQRLQWTEERLDRIRTLARKHRVDDAELTRIHVELTQRIAELSGDNQSVDQLEQSAHQARERFAKLAGKLSQARKRAGRTLSQQVTEVLQELGMPRGEFQVALTPLDEPHWDSTGCERVEFLVALNPGQPAGSLAKVASGGELSRVSLSIQVVASAATAVPTMVFDEVDAGIGGGVAEIVGRRLRELGSERQVLCVTHLPQVASQGQHHYRVAKLSDGETTRTIITALAKGERVEELSRMLGGVEITDRTRAHAEEMIERASA